MNLGEVNAIQKLDSTVAWAYRPSIEIEGIGTVEVAPVQASPGDKPKSYWARSPKHKKVVFAESPSKAVWVLIGRIESEARMVA